MFVFFGKAGMYGRRRLYFVDRSYDEIVEDK